MHSHLTFLAQDEVKRFIRENAGSDPNKLILNPPPAFKEHIKEIAGQILARQKAKGKFDAWASNYDLIMPPPLSIEQASSAFTCDYKTGLISGKHLFDLTGGMGIDCLAISQSFANSTYVERESVLCELFDYNTKVLGKEIEIVNEESSVYLKELNTDPEETYIYLDPARRDKSTNRVFRIEDCSPNLIDLMPILEKKTRKVLVKFSPMLDIKAAITRILNIAEIHIVSVKNECKEVLILIDFLKKQEPSITSVNLHSEQNTYSFTHEQEAESLPKYGVIQAYVYEPNSSIMKAGAFGKIATDFNLIKLGENTHLYTSEFAIKEFPGRKFKVIESVNKKSIGKYAPKRKINVITRNYPLNANELKKKWKIKDGGEFFLLGYTDINNRAQTVAATRIDH